MANHHTREIPTPTAEERAQLERWAKRPKTAQALALRARIVLGSAEGFSDAQVAERLGITRPTANKWRRRFLERGCDGLIDEVRPGAPRTISDDDIERVITETLENTPRDATHWSTRSMARQCGISSTTVNRCQVNSI